MCKRGCIVGGSGICSPQRAGVEELLPLLHPGSSRRPAWSAGRSQSKLRGVSAVAPFRGTFDHTLDAKNRLTVPAPYRSALADGVVLALPVDLKPCVCIWHPDDYESYSRRALDPLPPLSPRLGEMERFLFGNSVDAELDAAG